MSKQDDLETVASTSNSSTPEDEIKTYSFVRKLSKKLDSFGVESRGIERIKPYERSTNKTRQFVSVMGLWVSGCGGLSSMSSFFLGPLLYGLGLKQALVIGLVGQTVGCFVAAYCSLMGPRSGCRQMVSARFLFGWWFVKLVCVVAVVGVMGWSIVNCVIGGQILLAISNGAIPLVASIVIIAVVSLVISIGGIKHLLRVEAGLSLPVSLAFLLLYVVSSQKYEHLTNNPMAGLDSATVKGNMFSYFSLCYSTTSTWGALASDYYILFPENTPDIQVFSLTFFGIFFPTTFVGIVAILIGNVAVNYAPWDLAYEELGMGGLLNVAFKPWGAGGKFLLALIFLSLISNNIINTYSAAFGMQLIGLNLARIPRWCWAIVMTIVYLVCAIVGRNKLSTILGNFLPMVGYWLSIYFIILLEENMIFRTSRFAHLYTKEFDEVTAKAAAEGGTLYCKRRDVYYNFLIWNDQKRLTQGYAATAAFIIGATGAAVGMAQTYWIGPLAKKVGGEWGGDIGMWLCIGFSGLVYPGLRYFELKRFGR